MNELEGKKETPRPTMDALRRLEKANIYLSEVVGKLMERLVPVRVISPDEPRPEQGCPAGLGEVADRISAVAILMERGAEFVSRVVEKELTV